MTTRSVAFVPGEFYHLYNRGTEKRTIYLDKSDYRRFVELLYLCNSTISVSVRDVHRDFSSIFEFDRGKPVVAIGAYCLMPNHFHILATPLVENGISIFMNKLGTGYSMYFNKRYTRSGSLFQGTFKAQHASSDEYLKYLYAYIHLNPVKLIDPHWREEGNKDVENSFKFASTFQYSSLSDQLGLVREESAIVDSRHFPEYFLKVSDIKNELYDWLSYESATN